MPPATLPEGLDVIESMTGTTVRLRWFTWMVIPMLLFAIAWDGFLVFWYSIAFKSPNAPLLMKLFPLGHVLIGISMTYYAIASLFNKTDVRLNPSYVEVASGPFPWLGNKRFMASDVRQLVVRQGRANRGSVSFKVMYAGDDRKEKKLVSGINRIEQAEFIASMTREALGISGKKEE